VLAQEVVATREEFAAAYWPHRPAYDLGGDERGYWESVCALLGREPEPSLLDRLSRLDAAKWSSLPPTGQALLDQLAGVRLGVLSNAPAPLAASVRAAGWSAAVDVLVFSAEVGLAKPDPRIYARADAAFGVAPGDVVFFDDREENVAAARAHGWDAHVWVEGMTAADVLTVRGLPIR
jgi:putative hydrolase of the HAD superfamily